MNSLALWEMKAAIDCSNGHNTQGSALDCSWTAHKLHLLSSYRLYFGVQQPSCVNAESLEAPGADAAMAGSVLPEFWAA